MNPIQVQIDALIASNGYSILLDAISLSLNKDFAPKHRYRRDMVELTTETLAALILSFNQIQERYDYTPGKVD